MWGMRSYMTYENLWSREKAQLTMGIQWLKNKMIVKNQIKWLWTPRDKGKGTSAQQVEGKEDSIQVVKTLRTRSKLTEIRNKASHKSCVPSAKGADRDPQEQSWYNARLQSSTFSATLSGQWRDTKQRFSNQSSGLQRNRNPLKLDIAVHWETSQNLRLVNKI